LNTKPAISAPTIAKSLVRLAGLDRLGHQPGEGQAVGHRDALDHRRRRIVGAVPVGMLDEAESRRAPL
jgi:hypothetical protein